MKSIDWRHSGNPRAMELVAMVKMVDSRGLHLDSLDNDWNMGIYHHKKNDQNLNYKHLLLHPRLSSWNSLELKILKSRIKKSKYKNHNRQTSAINGYTLYKQSSRSVTFCIEFVRIRRIITLLAIWMTQESKWQHVCADHITRIQYFFQFY